MKIVADENIPFLCQFFGEIGDIVELSGRKICAQDLVDADILIVRSVTRVDKTLLKGSSVKFVGSCTIGVDHVDTDYLNRQGIVFANAPGSNANSVVEYILSCLSILTETHGFQFEQLRVGIVGYGNVGSLLASRLERLGVRYLACDPFLDQEALGLVSLDEALACDLVSLHVPLTASGDYPTHHMIDQSVLARFREEQVLINTSRGAVVDNAALRDKLECCESFTAILDVWEGEPDIDPELAKRVFIGTPHIAGYSFDGKVAGTEMIYRSLCKYMGLPVRHQSGQFLEEPSLSRMTFTSNAEADWSFHTAIRACFDVRHDHGLLRSTLNRLPAERSAAFDGFRKSYRCRREFSGVKVQLKQVDSEIHSKFKALGFNVKS